MIPSKADTLIGRDTLVTEMAAHLAENRNVSLVGARGMGKSSVLRAAAARLTRLQVPGPVVLVAALRNQDPRSFLGDVVDAMAKEVEASPAEPGRCARDGRLLDALESLREHAFQTGRDFAPILFLDDLHKLDFAVLSSMLHPAMNNARVAVVVCGSPPLDEELRRDVSSTLHLIAMRGSLTPFSLAETDALLDFERTRSRVIPPTLGRIAQLYTQGHPYKLRYLLNRLFARGGAITVDAFVELTRSEAGYFRKTLHDDAAHQYPADEHGPAVGSPAWKATPRGQRARIQRDRLGLSQEELGFSLRKGPGDKGYSGSAVSKWETEQRDIPRELLPLLAELLGLDESDL